MFQHQPVWRILKKLMFVSWNKRDEADCCTRITQTSRSISCGMADFFICLKKGCQFISSLMKVLFGAQKNFAKLWRWLNACSLWSSRPSWINRLFDLFGLLQPPSAPLFSFCSGPGAAPSVQSLTLYYGTHKLGGYKSMNTGGNCNLFAMALFVFEACLGS